MWIFPAIGKVGQCYHAKEFLPVWENAPHELPVDPWRAVCALHALWESLSKLWIWEIRKEFKEKNNSQLPELQSGSGKCGALPLNELYVIFIYFLLCSLSQWCVLGGSSWSVLWEYVGNMSQNVPVTSRCIHRQKSSLHSIKQKSLQ